MKLPGALGFTSGATWAQGQSPPRVKPCGGWPVTSGPCQAAGSLGPNSASGGGDGPRLGIPFGLIVMVSSSTLPFLTTLVVTSCQGPLFTMTIFILQTVKPKRREVRPARGGTGSNEEALTQQAGYSVCDLVFCFFLSRNNSGLTKRLPG